MATVGADGETRAASCSAARGGRIDERVTDELDRHVAFPVGSLFERKDHQHRSATASSSQAAGRHAQICG
jgi:hypothetical protein